MHIDQHTLTHLYSLHIKLFQTLNNLIPRICLCKLIYIVLNMYTLYSHTDVFCVSDATFDIIDMFQRALSLSQA